MYGFDFKGIIATDKDGNQLFFRTVKDFCDATNGNSGHVSKVLNGERKTHKGYYLTFA